MRPLQRQVIAGLGVSEEEVDAELAERLLDIERLQQQDEGVSSVLLLAAQAELGRLRTELTAATAAAAAAPPVAAEVRLRAALQAGMDVSSFHGRHFMPHTALPCTVDNVSNEQLLHANAVALPHAALVCTAATLYGPGMALKLLGLHMPQVQDAEEAAALRGQLEAQQRELEAAQAVVRSKDARIRDLHVEVQELRERCAPVCTPVSGPAWPFVAVTCYPTVMCWMYCLLVESIMS